MKEATNINIKLVVNISQIWEMIQQLPDTLKVEILDKLQRDLEEKAIIEKRTSRQQRLDDTTTLGDSQPQVTQRDIINFEKIEDEETEMTEEEFYQAVKKI